MNNAVVEIQVTERVNKAVAGGSLRRFRAGVLALLCFGLSVLFIVPALAQEFPGQGIYEICSVIDEGFVLDAKHCTQQETVYDTLQMYRPLQVKQQEFYLEFASAHGCRIISLETGQYLTETDVAYSEDGQGKPASAAVRLAQKAQPAGEGEKDRQFFSLVAREDGSYLIGSASGLYLTLADTKVYNGTEVSLQPFTGGKAQKWLIRQVPIYAGAVADTDAVNPYLEDGPLSDVKVTVRFRDTTETITADTLASWTASAEGDAHGAMLDEQQLRAWVTQLAEKYNTVGKARTFVTSYKVPITLTKGNFGWKMDEEATFATLKEAVLKGGRRSIVPSWSQKAGDFYGTNSDIGDSYVEVDLNAQKVWLYKNGKLLVETDCVSGTAGTDRETPGGVYSIFYMQAPAVLNGPGYSNPVNFWMPFNGGIGLHDAPWRSEFGGEIYKTNGSHGCINLPYDAAKTIYETVEIGYPVVCYH